MSGKPSYSSVVKKHTSLENDCVKKDWQYIYDSVRKLIQRKPPSDIKRELETIIEAAKQIYQQNNHDRSKDQEVIRKLKTKVIILESQVEQLQEELHTIDTIDTGEAMKIMGDHVAGFVLPPQKDVAPGAGLEEMISYLKSDKREETALATWNRLQQKCRMQWTDIHREIKFNSIFYRNIAAHKKKFNLTKLRRAMQQGRSHNEKYVNDIMDLFEKVESLTKFRLLASDSGVNEVIKEKYSENHNALLQKIKGHEKCRNVKYLQDIKIQIAKSHLVDYLEITEIGPLDDIIKEIFETISPRLGKLVKEYEGEVVKQILHEKSTITFEEMNDSLDTCNEYVVKQWIRLTGGKEWTKCHSEAIKKLKGLLPAKYSKKYCDLRLDVAQSLIPDVLEERLWDAGSDILEIFVKWEEKKKKHKDDYF